MVIMSLSGHLNWKPKLYISSNIKSEEFLWVLVCMPVLFGSFGHVNCRAELNWLSQSINLLFIVLGIYTFAGNLKTSITLIFRGEELLV